MFVSSRPAFWQVVAIAIVINLIGFGSPALKAQDHDQYQGCQQSVKECPAPVVREKPVPPPQTCCPAPVVREKPLPPPQTCCPVDPKEVHKAEKAAEHAQHEAAEECKRQQHAAQKAQHELDEANARATDKIDKANAKYEQDRADWAEAQAKVDSLNASSNEAVAQTPSSENDIMRSKPSETPIPEATPEVTPAPEPESTLRQKPTPEPETAAPAPMPEQTQEKPKELPKTASPLDLIGLIGLVSMSGGYLTRFF